MISSDKFKISLRAAYFLRATIFKNGFHLPIVAFLISTLHNGWLGCLSSTYKTEKKKKKLFVGREKMKRNDTQYTDEEEEEKKYMKRVENRKKAERKV